jgi:hypothetical protein
MEVQSMKDFVATVYRCSRPVLWGVVAILSAGVAGVIVKGLGPRAALAAGSHTFTVDRREDVYGKNGILYCENHYIEGTRCDGSQVFQLKARPVPGPADATLKVRERRIYSANGDLVRINEATGQMSTFPRGHLSIPVHRGVEASCLAPEAAHIGFRLEGEESVGPYRAAKVVWGNGGQHWTAWYGLDFGCAMLQQRMDHDDGLTTQTLESITSAEPDPALFEVAGLVEVPPSKLFPEPNEAHKQHMDGVYYEAWRKAGMSPGQER